MWWTFSLLCIYSEENITINSGYIIGLHIVSCGLPAAQWTSGLGDSEFTVPQSGLGKIPPGHFLIVTKQIGKVEVVFITPKAVLILTHFHSLLYWLFQALQAVLESLTQATDCCWQFPVCPSALGPITWHKPAWRRPHRVLGIILHRVNESDHPWISLGPHLEGYILSTQEA